MLEDRIEKIEKPGFLLFVVDLRDLDEEEILYLFKESTRMAHEMGQTYGTIYNTEQGIPTPKIRQLGKRLTEESEKKGFYIGSAIYGVNVFIEMVARLASKKVQFGKDKEDCIKILTEMFEGERPNYLSKN